MSGGAGEDKLFGGAGADKLNGGTAPDTCTAEGDAGGGSVEC